MVKPLNQQELSNNLGSMRIGEAIELAKKIMKDVMIFDRTNQANLLAQKFGRNLISHIEFLGIMPKI